MRTPVLDVDMPYEMSNTINILTSILLLLWLIRSFRKFWFALKIRSSIIEGRCVQVRGLGSYLSYFEGAVSNDRFCIHLMRCIMSSAILIKSFLFGSVWFLSFFDTKPHINSVVISSFFAFFFAFHFDIQSESHTNYIVHTRQVEPPTTMRLVFTPFTVHSIQLQNPLSVETKMNIPGEPFLRPPSGKMGSKGLYNSSSYLGSAAGGGVSYGASTLKLKVSITTNVPCYVFLLGQFRPDAFKHKVSTDTFDYGDNTSLHYKAAKKNGNSPWIEALKEEYCGSDEDLNGGFLERSGVCSTTSMLKKVSMGLHNLSFEMNNNIRALDRVELAALHRKNTRDTTLLPNSESPQGTVFGLEGTENAPGKVSVAPPINFGLLVIPADSFMIPISRQYSAVEELQQINKTGISINVQDDIELGDIKPIILGAGGMKLNNVHENGLSPPANPIAIVNNTNHFKSSLPSMQDIWNVSKDLYNKYWNRPSLSFNNSNVVTSSNINAEESNPDNQLGGNHREHNSNVQADPTSLPQEFGLITLTAPSSVFGNTNLNAQEKLEEKNADLYIHLKVVELVVGVNNGSRIGNEFGRQHSPKSPSSDLYGSANNDDSYFHPGSSGNSITSKSTGTSQLYSAVEVFGLNTADKDSRDFLSCTIMASQNDIQTYERAQVMNKIQVQNDCIDDDCVICLCEEKQVVLLPCRHLCVCAACLVHIDKCPVCRTGFEDHIVLGTSPKEQYCLLTKQIGDGVMGISHRAKNNF